jgi:hypothetical protein
MKENKFVVPPCPECGARFDNVFDATAHLLEDDQEFNPAFILPSGHKLMLGSLLQCLYKYANSPKQIKEITQSTYMTLFTAETNPEVIQDMVEDMVVASNMMDIDDDLKKLLKIGE